LSIGPAENASLNPVSSQGRTWKPPPGHDVSKSAGDNSRFGFGGEGSSVTRVSTQGDAMGTVTEQPLGTARGPLARPRRA